MSNFSEDRISPRKLFNFKDGRLQDIYLKLTEESEQFLQKMWKKLARAIIEFH